jgi:GntR family negative regulator for fad regulon and positive regulator of fabA
VENWDMPLRPAELAEKRLIHAILDDQFPINSKLPSERDLAAQLGVTRPTLRETLQRLARDGWIEIRHGKPTRVRDYWHEGNLAVLGAVARHQDHLPPNFIPNLLQIRTLLAPSYTRLAVQRSAKSLVKFLAAYLDLRDTPEAFAQADWELHRKLTVDSGNPIFTLILNGFKDLYPAMGCLYFASAKARARSRQFYADLLKAVQANDPAKAARVTQAVMADSVDLWKAAKKQ